MDTLAINFIPLINQDFSFKVFKKKCNENETIKDFSFSVNKYSLPIDNFTNVLIKERIDYFISLEAQNNFEESVVNSSDKRQLTIRYIFHLLQNKLKTLKYLYKTCDNFLNIIDFIMEEDDVGKKCIRIIPSYINNKYGAILDYHFIKNKDVSNSVEVQKKSLSLDQNGQSNKNYYSDKYDWVNHFIINYFTNISKALNEDGSITFSANMLQISSRNLNVKKYLFKGENIANSQFNGIKSFGPFSKPCDEWMFGFIFRNDDKPLSHELYFALKGERFATFKGMNQMFGVKFEKNNVIGEGVTDFSELEINRVISIFSQKANGKNIIPIILMPWDKNTATEAEKRLYYYIKHSFLKSKMPCQFVSVTKVKSESVFKWLVSGIGLQIFSKIGGEPWCLVPSTKKCLIIGIGQAHQKNDENIIERYYSYSIQNDSSGLFKNIKILSDNRTQDEYLNGLSIKLREVIISNHDNYDSFVIHTSFRLQRREMKTIRDTIEKLATEKNSKRFAVLRFNNEHHFMCYDLSNSSLTPHESSCIKLFHNNFLIWFEGLQYGYSSVKERIGPPVQVSIDYTTTDDIFSYLQDAVNLSGANWRGFNAKSLPVSVLYAHLLSGFIAAFNKHNFDDINIENITPWFI